MPEGVSLRRRLTLYLVSTMLIMTLASGTAVYLSTQDEADEVFSASLVQTARILDQVISLEAIESNRERLQRALQSGSDDRHKVPRLFFAIFDADGNILLQSDMAPKVGSAAVAAGFSEFRHQGRKWFTYGVDSSLDELLLVVGQRSKDREEITEHLGAGLLLPLILLMPLMLWLLWHVIGVALRPLKDVTAQVRRQDIRQLQPIDVDGVPVEIDPLVKALNRMIVDLDAAYARERRFVSDASHELRNPLASLLINVDNAIEENRDASAREALDSMKNSIRRLSHLVSQLLELSHFENPLSGRTLARVDLCRICRQVVDSFESRPAETELDIELQLPLEGCEIRGEESLLSSLVTNLVDNAVKYGGADARIRVRCTRDANGLLLEIEDSGAGLDTAQRARALGRFYRAADTNTAGAGLGLSIAKTIADIHNARLELEESELGGLAVRVRFDSD